MNFSADDDALLAKRSMDEGFSCGKRCEKLLR